MDKLMTALGAMIGGLFLVMLTILYGAFAGGYVVSVGYEWFVLPIFPSLPHFTLHQIIGLCLFLGTLKSYSMTSIKDEYRNKTAEWVGAILSPWITLILMWFLKATVLS